MQRFPFARTKQPQAFRRIRRPAGVLYFVVHSHYFGEYPFRQIFVRFPVGKVHQHAFAPLVYVYIVYQVEGGFTEHHVALLYQCGDGIPILGNPTDFQRSACRQAVFAQIPFQAQRTYRRVHLVLFQISYGSPITGYLHFGKLRSAFPSDVLQGIAQAMIYLEVLLLFGQAAQRLLAFLPAVPAEVGDGACFRAERILVRCGFDEIHPRQVFSVRTRVPGGSACFGQAQLVGYLVFIDVSLLPVAGALLRPYQEQGVLHPLLIGHCHPVVKRTRHLSVISYYYRRYGGGMLAVGKFLFPSVYFLLLRAVNQHCGQVLFVFPADEYGCQSQRFVRGHFQPLEVNGQFYVQMSVRKREPLSGDEHFPPVEFLCAAGVATERQRCQSQRNTD